MNIAEQLDAVSGTNRLVQVEFYADWSPHYEWLEPVVRTYEKQVSEVIKVNIVEDKAVADSFNIETAPAFILLQRGHELWRQVGELTIDELKLVLEEFKQQSADYAVLYFLPDVAYATSGSLFMGYQITAYIPVPVFQ